MAKGLSHKKVAPSRPPAKPKGKSMPGMPATKPSMPMPPLMPGQPMKGM